MRALLVTQPYGQDFFIFVYYHPLSQPDDNLAVRHVSGFFLVLLKCVMRSKMFNHAEC
jgi:hypothetical protein